MTAQWWHPETLLHPLWLVINALAAFRLTRLLAVDMLPPIPRVRAAVERWARARWTAELDASEGHDAKSALLARHRMYGDSPALATLVTCPWCLGFWVALLTALLSVAVPTGAWVWLAVPLALSAVTGLLNQAADR